MGDDLLEQSPAVLPITSELIADVPVMLASGRAMLAISPEPTGSPTASTTIGMVLVEALAANDACVTAVTITSTSSRTSSAASAGKSLKLPIGETEFD